MRKCVEARRARRFSLPHLTRDAAGTTSELDKPGRGEIDQPYGVCFKSFSNGATASRLETAGSGPSRWSAVRAYQSPRMAIGWRGKEARFGADCPG